jgi:hypothetical protein
MVESLVDAHVLPELPANPFGGTYVIDPLTGRVRSSGARQPARLYQSPMRAKALRGEPLRDL